MEITYIRASLTWHYGFLVRYEDNSERVISCIALVAMVGRRKYDNLIKLCRKAYGHWHKVPENLKLKLYNE